MNIYKKTHRTSFIIVPLVPSHCAPSISELEPKQEKGKINQLKKEKENLKIYLQVMVCCRYYHCPRCDIVTVNSIQFFFCTTV